MKSSPATIVPYRPEYALYFERFNKAWISEFYKLEPRDIYVLENPEEAILQHGGRILFARRSDEIIGAVALRPIAPGVVELTKMAVDTAARGAGAGRLLCESAIAEALRMGARRLILYSSRRQETAIRLYRRIGFEEIPLEANAYERADIKMEYPLTDGFRREDAGITPWFDRRFDFGSGPDQHAILYARLQQGPERCRLAAHELTESILPAKPGGKWSVKEHIGHLALLESLWRIRIQDIRSGLPRMSPADLTNRATEEAGFNDRPLEDLLDWFGRERSETLALLDSLDAEDYEKISLHPRLDQSMNIRDLMLFVAEHDDHHLNTIRQLADRHAR